MKDRLTITHGDYRDVKVPEDSIIFCDPPYNNSYGYDKKSWLKSNFMFDTKAVGEWASAQKSPVFLTEYEASEDEWHLITSTKLQLSGNACGGNNKSFANHERLYIHKKDKEWYYKTMSNPPKQQPQPKWTEQRFWIFESTTT